MTDAPNKPTPAPEVMNEEDWREVELDYKIARTMLRDEIPENMSGYWSNIGEYVELLEAARERNKTLDGDER